jgi:hypothetical protein
VAKPLYALSPRNGADSARLERDTNPPVTGRPILGCAATLHVASAPGFNRVGRLHRGVAGSNYGKVGDSSHRVSFSPGPEASLRANPPSSWT